MIAEAEKSFEKVALLIIYYSFDFPYLIYDNHILSATYLSNLRQLLELKNIIVESIYSSTFFSVTSSPLKQVYDNDKNREVKLREIG